MKLRSREKFTAYWKQEKDREESEDSSDGKNSKSNKKSSRESKDKGTPKRKRKSLVSTSNDEPAPGNTPLTKKSKHETQKSTADHSSKNESIHAETDSTLTVSKSGVQKDDVSVQRQTTDGTGQSIDGNTKVTAKKRGRKPKVSATLSLWDAVDVTEEELNRNTGALISEKDYPDLAEWINKISKEMLPSKELTFLSCLRDLNVPQCRDCCSLYHCPLCTHHDYPASHASRLKAHILSMHWNKQMHFGSVHIVRCNLPCEAEGRLISTSHLGHWHCPLCSQIRPTTRRLMEHLRAHSQGTALDTMQHGRVKSLLRQATAVKEVTYTEGDFRDTEPVVQDTREDPVIDPGQEVKNTKITEEVSSQVIEHILEDASTDNVKSVVQEISQKAINVENDSKETVSKCASNQFQSSSPEVKSPDQSPKKRKKAFQTVAAVISGDFLQSLPIAADSFALLLSSATGAKCNVVKQIQGGGVEALLQGTWQQVKYGKAILEVLEESEPNSLTDLVKVLNQVASTHKAGIIMIENMAEVEEAPVQVSAEPEDIKPDISKSDSFLAEDDISQDTTGSEIVNDQWEEDAAKPDASIPENSDEGQGEAEEEEIEESKKRRGKNFDVTSKKAHCPFCSKRFRSNWGLLPHVDQAHPDIEKGSVAHTFTGEEKNYVENLFELVHRMKSVSGETCENCQKQFKVRREGQIHYALQSCVKRRQYSKLAVDLPVEQGTGLYKCRHCDFTSHEAKRVIHHEERNHLERTVPCQLCGKLFASNLMVEEHVRQAHIYSKKQVVCDICGASVSAPYLAKHKQSMHDPTFVKTQKPRSQWVQCPKCPYQAPKPCLLRKHIKRKHEEKQLQCPHCTVMFALEPDLQQHIKNIHEDADNPFNCIVACKECGKEMKQRNMALHIKQVHRKHKEFACGVCLKAFSTRNSLKVHHMMMHTRPEDRHYKFTCSYCGAGFVNKTIYHGHLNTHTGHRPYKCGVCDKAFKQITTYHSHMQTHKTTRYPCTVCSQVFNSKANLVAHSKQHPYWECVCELKLPSLQELEAHQAGCATALMNRPGAVINTLDVTTSADITEANNGTNYIMIQPNKADDGGLSAEKTFVMVQNANDGTEEMTLTQILDKIQSGDVPTEGVVQLVQVDESGMEQEVLTEHGQDDIVLEQNTAQVVIEGGAVNDSSASIKQEVEWVMATDPQGQCEGDEVTGVELEEAEEVKAYMCGHCQLAFADLNDVQQHMLEQHIDEETVDEQT